MIIDHTQLVQLAVRGLQSIDGQRFDAEAVIRASADPGAAALIRRGIVRAWATDHARLLGDTRRVDAIEDAVAPVCQRISVTLGTGRADALLLPQSTNASLYASPIPKMEGEAYDQFLDAIPVHQLAVGAATYTVDRIRIDGGYKPFAAGGSNDLNPLVPSMSQEAPLPVHTMYVDDLSPDWLQTAHADFAGANYRPAFEAHLQTVGKHSTYKFGVGGHAGLQGYTLATLPMGRLPATNVWSAAMTAANVDTYTGEVATLVGNHKIDHPVAFSPKRAFVASVLATLLASKSNYEAGATADALGLLRAKLAGQGITEVVSVDFLNDIGGTGVHGILCIGSDAVEAGALRRVMAMAPTPVVSWQHQGRNVTRWALRAAGLTLPVGDAALQILITAT